MVSIDSGGHVCGALRGFPESCKGGRASFVPRRIPFPHQATNYSLSELRPKALFQVDLLNSGTVDTDVLSAAPHPLLRGASREAPEAQISQVVDQDLRLLCSDA